MPSAVIFSIFIEINSLSHPQREVNFAIED